MIKKLILISMGYIITIGVITYVLYAGLGINLGYIERIETQYVTYWKFNLNDYIQGINASLTSILQQKILVAPELPEFKWDDVITSIKTIGNILIMLVNLVGIFLINIIIVPIKIIAYIVLTIASLFGLNVEDLNIIAFARNIYSFSLDYIAYI